MQRRFLHTGFTLSLVFAIIATGCGNSGVVGSPSPGAAEDGLTLTTEVSCDDCQYSDVIEIFVIAKNGGTDPVVLKADDVDRPILILRIRKTDDETWTDLYSSITVGLGGNSLILEPTQRWIKRLRWNQMLIVLAEDGMAQATSGRYEVEATVLVRGGGEGSEPKRLIAKTTFSYNAAGSP